MMGNTTRRNSLLFFIFLFVSFNAFSQNPKEFLNIIKEEYPDENFVQLEKNIHFEIFINDGKLEIEVEEKEKYIYFNNVNNVPITLSTYSSGFNELVESKAYSFIPNENKYKKIEVKDFNEKINVDNLSFYDDVKERIFTFPGITDGTIIELYTKHKVKEPRLLKLTYLNTFIPIRNFSFSIDYDKDIDIEVIKYNVRSEDISVSQVENKKFKTYKCLANNLVKMKFEDYQPDLTYFLPHLIPKINKYYVDNNEIEILNDVSSLYKWYNGFINELNKSKKKNNELGVVVNELIENCQSEIEKVEKIYYWVQENIKYIAFEDGMGGFVPRDPYVTFKNKYGDCKDKSAIMYEMLEIAGIESYYTWIGTYDIPYTYDEVPTPLTDNHMIITYISNDKYYFLDGTSEYLNIDYPSIFIQGKEALIAKDNDEFEIKKVPVLNSSKNRMSDVVLLEINERDITGSGHCSFLGYYKTDLQYGLFLKNKDEQKKFVENSLEKGNNKFVLKDYTIKDLNSFSPELSIEYEFELNNFLSKVEDNLYVNLNFNRDWIKYKLKEDRANPVFLKYNTSIEHEYVLKIPKGYKVDFLPENFMNENDFYSYSINYQLIENEIIYTQKISVNTLHIDKTQFKEWNDFISKLENAYKQTIILKTDEN